ncbi:hypothetical protein [Streptomyces sp. NPDC001665]
MDDPRLRTCGRRASKSAEWSGGPICRTCYERAMRVRGRCPCCGTDRLLPAPAPVIAKALGCHDKTATRLVTEAGGTWSRNAPGDHTR